MRVLLNQLSVTRVQNILFFLLSFLQNKKKNISFEELCFFNIIVKKLFGNFLDFGGICWEIFKTIFWEEFFGRNFLGEIFWEDFLGGGFFWENFLGGITQ